MARRRHERSDRPERGGPPERGARSEAGGRQRGGRSPRGAVLPALAEPEPRVPRRLRVEGEILQEMANVLRGLRDPRLDEATVSRVQVTDDLQSARIYVRLGLLAQPDDQRAAHMLDALDAASGRIRRHIAQALRLRYAPAIRFTYDRGVDAARRIDGILAEIDAERGATPPSLAGDAETTEDAPAADRD